MLFMLPFILFHCSTIKAVADKIGVFVLQSGSPLELWESMNSSNLFGDHAAASQAMKDMKLLFSYLQAMNSLQYISFDMSLARGLDYYTGNTLIILLAYMHVLHFHVCIWIKLLRILMILIFTYFYFAGVIYEAVVINSNTSVGSIAAGGRYDNLVGKFWIQYVSTNQLYIIYIHT